jgi:hypothetical protein
MYQKDSCNKLLDESARQPALFGFNFRTPANRLTAELVVFQLRGNDGDCPHFFTTVSFPSTGADLLMAELVVLQRQGTVPVFGK